MDLVQHLENEYRDRLRSNPSYSLRAFARDLKIDQSSLSKALAGKRRFTEAVIRRITENLDLTPAQTRKFLSGSNAQLPTFYTNLVYDQFVAISEWYYDAILELADTVNFRFDPAWIAKRLNLRTSVVKSALQRLARMQLLVLGADGRWADNSKNNSIHPDKVTKAALRKYQEQVLAQSSKAIKDVDLSLRSHTSNTFACSPEKLEEAKRIIAKCRRDVAAVLRSSDEPKTEVYQVQISLFPLTRNAPVTKDARKHS